MKLNRFKTIAKWLFRSFLTICLLLILLVGTLPFWLGAAISTFAPEGVSFEHYERKGYDGFSLHGINVEMDGVSGTMEMAETLYPWTWLYRVSNGEREQPFLSLENGRFVIQPTGVEANAVEQEQIVYAELFDAIEKMVGLADKWAGHIVADRLEVVSGEASAVVEKLEWKDYWESNA